MPLYNYSLMEAIPILEDTKYHLAEAIKSAQGTICLTSSLSKMLQTI